ncbi:MAG: hypothetical protein JOZ31_09425 [Verrucomicrobia bacterium]|nr:hypothetical protein [Verrucomicrobiota bacterium]
MNIKRPASAAPIEWLVSLIAFGCGSYLNPFVAVDQLHNPQLRSITTTTNWFVWAGFAIAGIAFIAAIWFIICGNSTVRFLIGFVSCLGALVSAVALSMMGSSTGSEFFKVQGLEPFWSESSLRDRLWIVFSGLIALAALALLVSVIRRKPNRRS